MIVASDKLRRDWTTVGQEALDQYAIERERVEAEAESLEWVLVTDIESLPFIPGEAIKKVIRDIRIPRVSALAWNGVLEGREYGLSLYGIEATWKDVTTRIHVLDQGSVLNIVFVDVYPRQEFPEPKAVPA